MITYSSILEMAGEISENPLINKKGLTITYEVDQSHHKKLEEDIFYRINKDNKDIIFEHMKIFDVEVLGINFRFIKK